MITRRSIVTFRNRFIVVAHRCDSPCGPTRSKRLSGFRLSPASFSASPRGSHFLVGQFLFRGILIVCVRPRTPFLARCGDFKCETPANASRSTPRINASICGSSSNRSRSSKAWRTILGMSFMPLRTPPIKALSQAALHTRRPPFGPSDRRRSFTCKCSKSEGITPAVHHSA